MGCEQLHEFALSDIVNIISGIKEIRKDRKEEKMIAGYTSLSKAASNLTCVFPILISRNVPINTAQIITKACERDDVSMLQILFAAMSISQAEDGIQYVKSIHRNLKLGSGVDVDEFIRVMNNTLQQESTISDSQAYELLRADMRNINYTLPDSISERGLNEYTLIKEGAMYLLLEKLNNKVEFEKIAVPGKFNYDSATSAEIAKNAEDVALFYFYGDSLSVIKDKKDLYKVDTNGDYKFNLFFNDKYNDQLLDNIKSIYNFKGADANERAISVMNTLRNNLKSPDVGVLPRYNSIDDMDQRSRLIFKNYAALQMKEEGTDVAKLVRLILDGDSAQAQLRRLELQRIQLMNAEARAEENAKRLAKLDQDKLDLEKDKFEYQKERDKIQDDQNRVRAQQQYYTDLANRNSKMLLDTDVKKANELQPTLMNITFTRVVGKYKESQVPVAQSMVIGVKAKMVPLDSADIINRIINKNKDKNFFIKLFRATTREISFFKDLVFSVDKAKSDAISFSRKSKSSGIWKLLEKRSGKSKAARLMGTQNSAMAISTLIITAEEVEQIKKIANIDVEDPSVIAPIMDAYNLMGFGIVDDTLERFKLMRDNGERYYETYAYSALEKELADNTKAAVTALAAQARK